MGIYFRDILLIRISRGANNCGQHSLEKNIYFIMRFSPHFQLFYFNDRLEFCEFFEWKIKRIKNADLFSQSPLLIFIKGANISGGHCTYLQKQWLCTHAPEHTHIQYARTQTHPLLFTKSLAPTAATVCTSAKATPQVCWREEGLLQGFKQTHQ